MEKEQTKDDLLNLNKAKITPIAKDEIFVQVKNTHNYWVSNYGRVVNNLKGKNTFYFYKMGDVHLSLTNHYQFNTRRNLETNIKNLVADHFLFKISGKGRVVNVDGDKNNNYYKNLVYVDSKEQYKIRLGIDDISIYEERQEYINYIYKGHEISRDAYNTMYMRTHKNYDPKDSYYGVTMCDKWEKDPELAMEYLESIYYKVPNEQMVVDKDLLFPGNKEYAPGKVCWLPWSLNVALSNCKKAYTRKDSFIVRKINKDLPLGVRYDKTRDKYYGEITMDKALRDDNQTRKTIKLKYHNTPEEAFTDYKKHKEAYLIMLTDKYMKYLPVNVYDALVDFEVEPF